MNGFASYVVCDVEKESSSGWEYALTPSLAIGYLYTMYPVYLHCAHHLSRLHGAKAVDTGSSGWQKGRMIRVCLKQRLSITSFPSFPSQVQVPWEPSRSQEPSPTKFPSAACRASCDDPCGVPSSGAPSGCEDPWLQSFHDTESPRWQLGSRNSKSDTIAHHGLLTSSQWKRIANRNDNLTILQNRILIDRSDRACRQARKLFNHANLPIITLRIQALAVDPTE